MEDLLFDMHRYDIRTSWRRNFEDIDNIDEGYALSMFYSGYNDKIHNAVIPYILALFAVRHFKDYDFDYVCDVDVGVGNFMLAYLETIGEERAKKMLKEKRIILFEDNPVSLYISKKRIFEKYGIYPTTRMYFEIFENSLCLSYLPKKDIGDYEYSAIVSYSKDLESLNLEGGGYIYNFNGRPHSVLYEKDSFRDPSYDILSLVIKDKSDGFRTTGYINIKNDERDELLSLNLTSLLGRNKQYDKFRFVYPLYEELYDKWINISSNTLKSLTGQNKGVLSIKKNSYYNVSAFVGKIKGDCFNLYFDDFSKLAYAYLMLNSSLVFLYNSANNRYPLKLTREIIDNTPVFFDKMNKERIIEMYNYVRSKKEIDAVVRDMINKFLLYEVKIECPSMSLLHTDSTLSFIKEIINEEN